MSSNLKRTKVYFFVIAVLMSFLLFVFTYKWNVTDTLIRLPFNQTIASSIHLRGLKVTLQPFIDKTNNVNIELPTASESNDDDDKSELGNSLGPDGFDSEFDGIGTPKASEVVIKENGKGYENQTVKTKEVIKITDIDRKNTEVSNEHIVDTEEANIIEHEEMSITGEMTVKHGDESESTEWNTRETESVYSALKTNKGIDGQARNTFLNATLKTITVNSGVLSADEKEKIRAEIKKLKYELRSKDMGFGFEVEPPNATTPLRRRPVGLRATRQRYFNIPLRNRLLQLGQSNNNFNYDHNNVNQFSVLSADATSRLDSCSNCFDVNFKELINAPDVCKGYVDLLMIVTSTVENDFARNSIRKTWGAVCKKPGSKIRCVFFFGNKNNTAANKNLLKESDSYHDIVQLDFRDTYANLTYKTITSLKWSMKYCAQAKYVLKTDDDMYVNTDILPYFLKGAPDEKLIGGHCWGPSPPHRDTNSKWFVSYRQYTHPYFPTMCSGTGYIMSRDVVAGVVNISTNIPFFHLEDVYVAICVKKFGVTPVLLAGFKNEAVEFEACNYRNNLITSHGYQGATLEYIWKASRQCPMERMRSEFVYRPLYL